MAASLKVYAAVIVSRCYELGIRETNSAAGSVLIRCCVLEKRDWLSD